MTKSKILNSAYRAMKYKHLPATLTKLEGFDDLKESIKKANFAMFETYLYICGSQLAIQSKGKTKEIDAIKSIIGFLTDNSDTSRELTHYIMEQRFQGE